MHGGGGRGGCTYHRGDQNCLTTARLHLAMTVSIATNKWLDWRGCLVQPFFIYIYSLPLDPPLLPFPSLFPLPLPLPLPSPQVLSLSLWGGYLHSFTPSKINDRFLLGGPSTLRGFSMWGAGPRENGFSLGGEAYWATGLHLYTPLPLVSSTGLFQRIRLHGYATAGNIVKKTGTRRGGRGRGGGKRGRRGEGRGGKGKGRGGREGGRGKGREGLFNV